MREPVANVLTVDVEEYYHGVEFAQALGPAGLAALPSRVAGQTERLLDVLDAHRARATFFVLGVVAHRHPRLVRALAERGHEVASHGWDHIPVFRLGPAGFRADVRRARR
ncbi:MAG TPA: polysaccharide deacetylase family protein, partial [Methylomirabilota bacterium]|nr:polysaccharide deacetylase family protein [Methylomirabilota bacterium]